MNAQLRRDLNGDQRIDRAWYYNGKIFATNRQGIRHKFNILDNVDKKAGPNLINADHSSIGLENSNS